MAKFTTLSLLVLAMVFMVSCSKEPPAPNPSGSDTNGTSGNNVSMSGDTPGTGTEPKSNDIPIAKPTGTPERIAIPGTAISLIPPSGFAPTTLFLGVHQAETNSSIQITELPTPLSDTIKGFTDAENLSKKEMTLLSQKEVKVSGSEGTLLEISQKAYLMVFRKWILLLGDDTQSITIMGTFPEPFAEQLSEPLKKSVMSSLWDKRSAQQLASELPFGVTVEAPFSLATKIGDSLAYTIDGEFPLADANSPIILVGASTSAVAVNNPRVFAQARLFAAQDTTESQIEKSEFVEVDSLTGYAVTASARDKESHAPLYVYQVVLFNRDQFYTIKTRVGTAYKDMYEAAFKRTAASFRRR